MIDDKGRLLDILTYIEKIEKYTDRGKEAFEKDELLHSFFIRNFAVIGEAARGLSDNLKKKNHHIDWKKIIGMRNVLVHDYLGIELDIVWNIVQNDLPQFKKAVQEILNKINKG